MDDALAEVRLQFRQRCSGDLLTLRAAMRQPQALTAASFQTMVHRMAGIAGSLGFTPLGAAAAAVDRACSRRASIDPAGLRRLEIALSEVADPLCDPAAQ
ncbi:Hpt domain-containing protein [Phenylobacterium sp.]|uniref:Hpt domain-containing protein n=1 Tax=Phenylobacterium sp. TaxID=1871053 RepID=UPI002725808A|nr:Hpt domain-containing protein [Phenylobacterium sp.]MDO8801551.1 Hpt domain-containing protein [Phenylobacterium sp.]